MIQWTLWKGASDPLRIIAGTHKGRVLTAPKGDFTRPTADRVKEAVFSMIGPYLDGGVVLDLFAGTGALGIESLSRGAEHSVFVDKHTADVIETNLRNFGLQSRSTVLRAAYPAVWKRLVSGGWRYQWVFLDPPYRMEVCAQCMRDLAEGGLLQSRATIVTELGRDAVTPSVEGFRCVRESRYGDTKIAVFRWEGEDASSRISREF
ncbi:MAG: 16S rRNA (guanine(966)-N(2))-methyltransferase RsmD [Firmicutes bacterium]|nr:16S rRNA (guanine(966)-N(2))-methyltransferase RsmD [Bacillota bacterium]